MVSLKARVIIHVLLILCLHTWVAPATSDLLGKHGYFGHTLYAHHAGYDKPIGWFLLDGELSNIIG